MWDAYPSGAWVDLRTGDPARDDPALGARWDRGRTVRAEIIAALMLGARPAEPGKVAGLRLAGAHVPGDLDLSGATLTTTLHLTGCHVPGTVTLTDTTARGIRFQGCDIDRVRAARSTIDGLFELNDSIVHAGVRLDNARINGQLRLSGALLIAPQPTKAPVYPPKKD